jgi:hypothetical protein
VDQNERQPRHKLGQPRQAVPTSMVA